MASREEFITAWRTRFPTDQPPLLTCLENVNNVDNLERTLHSVRERIKQIEKELGQYEFIETFIWDKLHAAKGTLKAPKKMINGATVTETDLDLVDLDSLDSPVPLPEDSSQCEGMIYRNIADSKIDLEQPYSASTTCYGVEWPEGMKGGGAPQSKMNNDSSDFRKFRSSSVDQGRSPNQNQKRAGYRGSLTDSEKMLIGKDTSPDDGSNTAERKARPPVPAPRPSVKGPSFQRGKYGSFNSLPPRKSNSDRDSTASLPTEMTSYKLDTMPPPVPSHAKPAVPMLKPLNMNRRKPGSPEETPQGQINQNKDNDVTPTRCGSHKWPHNYANVDVEENEKMARGCSQLVSPAPDENEDGLFLYDNAIPVNKEEVETEESSSEDDEPLYYNIMLMKKQQMNDVSSANDIYASVDIQKRRLEQSAKRLSKRFSQNFDAMEDEEPPVPPKPFSSIPDVDEDTVSIGQIHNFTPSSVTDSVFIYPDSPRDQRERSDSIQSNQRDRSDSLQSCEPEVPTGQLWKKRNSMLLALEGDTASNSSASSEPDEGDGVPVASSPEDEKLQMRKWVVTSILDSEHNYADILDVLLQYMRSFIAAAKSSQPLICKEDIEKIFFKIPELWKTHRKFIHEIEPKVEAWSAEQEVAAIFKMLALEELHCANEYLKNYQTAVATIQRCQQENTQFQELTQNIKCKGVNEITSLEELLHKPVVRIQRNTLVLHDLIRCTPTSHPDYDILQKTLNITHHFFENFQISLNFESADNQRYMVKNGLIVEKVGSCRKLRHIFLFNDVFVCTKQKMSGRKIHFDIKWFIALCDLTIDSQNVSHEDKQLAMKVASQVQDLQKQVSKLQAELRTELRRNRQDGENNLKKNRTATRHWSIRSNARTIEKLKKKLSEQEAALVRVSPHLVFKVKNKQGKTYTLLMSSDYERNDWRDSTQGLKIKVGTPTGLTTIELQNQINSLNLARVNAITNMLDTDDWQIEEERLYGSLNITIHKMQGLKGPCDTFVSVEVDSYGHFCQKAKTNFISQTTEPRWDEDFEIDLDGAQTLRLLCYKMDGDRDVILGKCALELSKAWLKDKFQEKTITLKGGISVTVSLSYASREQTIKRTPSGVKGGLFGVRLATVAKRESTRVPLIISTCVHEIEKRGIDDLGIYRISGLSSEIQRLKKGFERNTKGTLPALMEAEINVVTGLLKLYLRELPEALFTDKLYPRFVEGMGLADPEAKEKCMISLIRELPEPNFSTALYLIDHIMRISKHEDKNKMSLQNLATVFGPTLLRPAAKSAESSSVDLFSAGARDAMLQTSILYFFLMLKLKGIDFEKSY